MALRGVDAVLLDALGTLVRFGPPAPRLAAALGVPLEDAARAMRAEIAFYRAEHHRAGDLAGLAALREDCARVVERELGTGLPLERVEAALLAALRFEPFPEVPGVLAGLRARGLRLVVCSNWDVSLHAVLRSTGLEPLLDGVVTSAEEGVAKPDPEIFARALARAGTAPGRAVHVGDDLHADVAGARAAGIVPVLVDRGEDGAPPGVRRVTDLRGLLD